MGFIGPVGEPGIVGEKVRLLATSWLLLLLQDEGDWGRGRLKGFKLSCQCNTQLGKQHIQGV